MFDVANIIKINDKDVPKNNYEVLSIQECSFHVFWKKGCTQSLVASCKYRVVLVVSSRVSG